MSINFKFEIIKLSYLITKGHKHSHRSCFLLNIHGTTLAKIADCLTILNSLNDLFPLDITIGHNNLILNETVFTY